MGGGWVVGWAEAVVWGARPGQADGSASAHTRANTTQSPITIAQMRAFEDKLDVPRVELILHKLVEHHPALGQRMEEDELGAYAVFTAGPLLVALTKGGGRLAINE